MMYIQLCQKYFNHFKLLILQRSVCLRHTIVNPHIRYCVCVCDNHFIVIWIARTIAPLNFSLHMLSFSIPFIHSFSHSLILFSIQYIVNFCGVSVSLYYFTWSGVVQFRFYFAFISIMMIAETVFRQQKTMETIEFRQNHTRSTTIARREIFFVNSSKWIENTAQLRVHFKYVYLLLVERQHWFPSICEQFHSLYQYLFMP